MIRILIGVCRAETGRSSAFDGYLDALQKPMGTMIKRVAGQSIAQNRNVVVKQAIETGCSHVFFIDDDVFLPEDALIKLICHNKDCITGLQLRRNFPHEPLLATEFTEEGGRIKYLQNGESGLVKIAASGLGCCLIKCKVFSKLDEPFFRLGEIKADELGEDFGFFKRIQKLGLEHYVDLDVHAGHMANTIVKPYRLNDIWLTTYDTAGTEKVSFPAVQLKSKEEESCQLTLKL